MKQKERIIEDVRECLRFFDLGHFDHKATIESINHITNPSSCEHCVYKDTVCKEDETKTCARGWSKYLESEV